MMNPLLSLGFVFLTAYIASTLLEKYIPADLVYVLIGILLGSVFNIIPESLLESEYNIAFLTMGMIAFLLSPLLSNTELRGAGKKIIAVSAMESIFTFFVVFIGFSAYFRITGESYFPWAVIFGALASLTSPAVSMMLFRESGTKGPLTVYSIGMSALDDVLSTVLQPLLLRTKKSSPKT
jgi:Kef-type K+ transport system membrane component KefB